MAAMEGCGDALEFSFQLTGPDAHLQAHTPVDSPMHSIGRFCVCLRVYISGVDHAGNKGVEAYLLVLVVPDVLCSDDWKLCDVHATIVIACDGRTSFVSPSRDATLHHGRDYLGWRATWLDMSRHGSSENAIHFNVSLKGDFSQEQPLREDLSVASQMWLSQKWCDVTLVSNTGAFLNCHGSVLATASPVLDRMLTSDLKEGQQKHITFPDMSLAMLRTFVMFLYSERLPKMADFQSLIRVADMYALPKLANLCAKALLQNLNEVSVASTFDCFCFHRQILDTDTQKEFMSNARAKPVVFRELAKHLLGKEVFQQDMIRHITNDPSLLDTIAGPLITDEWFSRKM